MMKYRKGFAGVTAVTLLAMLGVMLAAMGSFIAAEARRTYDAASEAQLRQLLLAGASAASGRLPLSGETKLALPPSLAADGYRLVIQPTGAAEPNTALVEIIAIAGEYDRRQTIRFMQRNGRWQMADAALEQ